MKANTFLGRRYFPRLAVALGSPLALGGCPAAALPFVAQINPITTLAFIGRSLALGLIGGFIYNSIFSPADAAELRDEALHAGVDEGLLKQTAQLVGVEAAIKSLKPGGTKIWIQENQTSRRINACDLKITNRSNDFWVGNIKVAIYDAKTGRDEFYLWTSSATFYPNMELPLRSLIEEKKLPMFGLKKLRIVDDTKKKEFKMLEMSEDSVFIANAALVERPNRG